MNNKVIKNKYGFYEIKDKPTNEELEKFYADTYFQTGGAYQKSYDAEELNYFNQKTEQRFIKLNNLLDGKPVSNKILDIGCGEAFVLEYFRGKGWDICGIDFSDYGCKSNNPNCLDKLIIGDIFEETLRIIEDNKKFDVVILQNLLEHVIDPEKLIIDLKHLLLPHSILVVTVPNDFSLLQKVLLEKEKVKNEYWIALPDHLSYFNKDSLKNLFEWNGYETCSLMADFPVDLFLLNDYSNYIQDKTKGKQAHRSKLIFEDLVHQTSITKTNNFYEMLADLNFGRNLTGYFRLK